MTTPTAGMPGPDAPPLNDEIRRRVINEVLTRLNERYVLPEMAAQMADAIREREKQAEYDGITDGEAFAERLTDDLRAVCQDRHLGVRYSKTVLPPERDGAQPTAEERARDAKVRRDNCGVSKVEHLSGNIGYLAVNFFAGDDAADALTKAHWLALEGLLAQETIPERREGWEATLKGLGALIG